MRPLLDILKEDKDAGCRVYAALTLSGLAPDVSDPDAAGEAVKVLIDRADLQVWTRRPSSGCTSSAPWGRSAPRATAAIPLLIKHIRDPIAWELRQAALASLASVAREVNKAPPG